MRRVLWCGEVLPTPALIYWMSRLPHARFTNLYGPTEATIASSFYTVPECPADPQASIPIGAPCAGEQLLVLDDARQPVAPGDIGGLYIGGVGLSPGYWRDPAQDRRGLRAEHGWPAAADLQHRRPRADWRRRPCVFLRARRLPDQEPRLPDRARGDRGGPEYRRRHPGRRGRGAADRRLRGQHDLLRLRAEICRQADPDRSSAGAEQSAARLHAAGALAAHSRRFRATPTAKSIARGSSSRSRPMQLKPIDTPGASSPGRRLALRQGELPVARVRRRPPDGDPRVAQNRDAARHPRAQGLHCGRHRYCRSASPGSAT